MASLGACTSSEEDRDRSTGQTSFESAPPNGSSRQEVADGAGGGAPPPQDPARPVAASGAPRAIEETDLYRLEGNRLYYLNSYRGLMVFDVTSPDQPRLLGRSPIFGDPVDMIVRNGIAIVVVGDWYGRMDDGTPFRGSIVRGLDATDPANIRVLGEAKLGGWVRDDRVVGDVIYAVSEDYGWSYGWEEGRAVVYKPAVIVSSVSFTNGIITLVDSVRYDGFAGVFNVTPTSIMLASASAAQGTTSLTYLDTSDPGGDIVPRGVIDVGGQVNGWGPDNGRWNLDFADGRTAHVLGQRDFYNGGFTLSTVDFSNPDAPRLASAMQVGATGWSAAARFVDNRLYLSPYGYSSGFATTPLLVYDLTNMAEPQLAGVVTLAGYVWNILPAPGARLFTLGNDHESISYGSSVSLQYLDVSEPALPRVLGTSTFGEGWAWTPAAGTFKAFTMDAAKGLVVLPFSGWSSAGGYNNGLQLIELSPTGVATAGSARTKGWVERGIFVGDRLVSLSDMSLSVVDYADRAAPKLVAELTLARNVVAALPAGDSIVEVSSDWWGYEATTSQLRVLPIGNAEETADLSTTVPTIDVAGVNARVFTHDQLAYIVTTVRSDTPCPNSTGNCFLSAQQVQVVDIASGAVLRGKIQLPVDDSAWYGGYGWGFRGCLPYDWWGGDEVVQVDGDALAVRRWQAIYSNDGKYIGTNSKLHIVDLANPDAPTLASTVVQPDTWWGNLRVVGDKLYTSHYEWIDRPFSDRGWVRYYLDQVDLSDRARPRIGKKVNVPGLIVGGDASDPSIVYTIDYRWNDRTDGPVNDFDVLRIQGSRATLLSHTTINGWVGSTFVRGDQAYLSAQRWTETGAYTGVTHVDLHAIDISNPRGVRDRVVSDTGWGWLLGVEGNRALVTSGWGSGGLDVYELRDGQAPAFDQTIRTRGWVSGTARQEDTLFLSSGYWGVQKVELE